MHAHSHLYNHTQALDDTPHYHAATILANKSPICWCELLELVSSVKSHLYYPFYLPCFSHCGKKKKKGLCFKY